MSEIVQSETLEMLINLRKTIREEVANLDDELFNEMIVTFHEVFDDLKDIVFDKRNREARKDFEEGWGGQSIQFVIDCIPEIHRII